MNYLGIDLGGTNIKAAVCTKEGIITGRASVSTDAGRGREAVLTRIALAADLAAQSAGLSLSDFNIAGLGVPGQLASPKGPVILAPNVDWNRFDALPRLQSLLGMDAIMANDADCMALAESRFGAGKPFESMLLLTLGTGVGGAIVANRRLFTGFGPGSGEFGYLPLVHGGFEAKTGPNGCLEEYCSSRGLCRIAESFGFGGKLSPDAIFAASQNEDSAALSAVELYTDLLAEALSGIVNVLRPSVVILGGGIAKAGAPLFDRINQKLPPLTYAWPDIPSPAVLPAALSDDGGAIGAAALVM